MVMNYDTYEIASRIRKYYEIEEEKATSHACVRFGIVCVRCGCILHISVMVSKCKHQIENYATKNMEKYTHTHQICIIFTGAFIQFPYPFQQPSYPLFISMPLLFGSPISRRTQYFFSLARHKANIYSLTVRYE